MAHDLDYHFALWLEDMRQKQPGVIEHEIENRVGPYQEIRDLLLADSIDPAAFYDLARKCTIMTYLNRYSKSALDNFFAADEIAERTLRKLVKGIPRSPKHAPNTIDGIIEYVEANSHLSKNQIAIIASLAMTAAHPDRFVDYPGHKRWEAFAKRMAYGLYREKSYGHRMVWASNLAIEISQTTTYRTNWPEDQFPFPLWIVSAFHWANKRFEDSSPDRP